MGGAEERAALDQALDILDGKLGPVFGTPTLLIFTLPCS